MGNKIKTDNASLVSKVALRRWLLGEMGITEARVLDTCAGAGHIWTAMQAHVTVARWVRCDVKPRQAGTLRLSAAEAVRSLALDRFNVIDIDPYGEPWDAYIALLPRLRQRTAVFLTRGRLVNVVTSNVLMEMAGLPASWKVPRTPSLAAYLDDCALCQTWQHARIEHAAAMDLASVSYYALALSPNK